MYLDLRTWEPLRGDSNTMQGHKWSSDFFFDHNVEDNDLSDETEAAGKY